MTKPESRINPDIDRADVGRRELKTLTIYPLSAAFQMNLAGDISDLLVDFFSVKVKDLKEDEVSQKIAGLFVQLLKKNIESVLGHVIDPSDLKENGYTGIKDLLEDLTNKQLINISEIIFENNYEDLMSKIKGFLQKMGGEPKENLEEEILKKALATKNALPSSADTTEAISSETSSSPTMKAE